MGRATRNPDGPACALLQAMSPPPEMAVPGLQQTQPPMFMKKGRGREEEERKGEETHIPLAIVQALPPEKYLGFNQWGK